MNDYEALLHQAERLEALQEIRNLMGRYSYLHSAAIMGPHFAIKRRLNCGQKEKMTNWSCLLENLLDGKRSDIVMLIFTVIVIILMTLMNFAD